MEQLTKLFADVSSIAKSLEILAKVATDAAAAEGTAPSTKSTPSATGEVKVDKVDKPAAKTTKTTKTTTTTEKPAGKTRDQMKAQVLAVKDATSKETAQRIFQPLGYETISAIADADFDKVYDAATKVLARIKLFNDAGQTIVEDALFADEEPTFEADSGDDL